MDGYYWMMYLSRKVGRWWYSMGEVDASSWWIYFARLVAGHLYGRPRAILWWPYCHYKSWLGWGLPEFRSLDKTNDRFRLVGLGLTNNQCHMLWLLSDHPHICIFFKKMGKKINVLPLVPNICVDVSYLTQHSHLDNR